MKILKAIREGVLAIVIYNAKILLVKQALDNYWGFPKGGIESHETNLESLIRELQEEVGIESFRKVISLNHSHNYVIPKEKWGNSGAKSKKYQVFVVVADSDKIKLNHELSDFKWVLINDLELTLKMPDLIKLVQDIKPKLNEFFYEI